MSPSQASKSHYTFYGREFYDRARERTASVYTHYPDAAEPVFAHLRLDEGRLTDYEACECPREHSRAELDDRVGRKKDGGTLQKRVCMEKEREGRVQQVDRLRWG